MSAQTHEIFRQLGYIQQALSQNKKPIGFFIAAGCPLSVRVNPRTENGKNITDPLIPDVAGLTTIITTKLSSGNPKAPSDCDKLVTQMKGDGTKQPNIEEILTQIRTMKSVSGIGKVRDFDSDQLKKLDDGICKIITEEVDKELPNKETAYHDLAIWSRSLERVTPVHIFTTNYDLLAALSLRRIYCSEHLQKKHHFLLLLLGTTLQTAKGLVLPGHTRFCWEHPILRQETWLHPSQRKGQINQSGPSLFPTKASSFEALGIMPEQKF